MEPATHATCESCGAPAEVILDDWSTWCSDCDTAARRSGLDQTPGHTLAVPAAVRAQQQWNERPFQ